MSSTESLKAWTAPCATAPVRATVTVPGSKSQTNRALVLAGLWSVWKPAKDGAPLLSCTIITTDAPGELAEIHDRMPLVVAERDWDRWLDPDAPIDEELLTRPPDVRDIRIREVSTLVNSVRNNGAELLEPVDPRPEQARLL